MALFAHFQPQQLLPQHCAIAFALSIRSEMAAKLSGGLTSVQHGDLARVICRDRPHRRVSRVAQYAHGVAVAARAAQARRSPCANQQCGVDADTAQAVDQGALTAAYNEQMQKQVCQRGLAAHGPPSGPACLPLRVLPRRTVQKDVGAPSC